jgi:uncharacterized protein (DUF2147 family)
MFSLFAIAMMLAGAQDVAPATPSLDGVWTNPKNTVEVRTGQCGDKLCGWVIWASEKAKADSAKKGAPPLIGTALLRDYKVSGKAQWAGQLFVPDMNSTFGSTIALLNGQTLRVKGCVLGGLICKSQDWHRVTGGSSMAAR